MSRPTPSRDGSPFLYSFELARLRLDADVVVFSACDTALGMLRPGEGLIGFSRSLFAAGASAAVLSLCLYGTGWPSGSWSGFTSG